MNAPRPDQPLPPSPLASSASEAPEADEPPTVGPTFRSRALRVPSRSRQWGRRGRRSTGPARRRGRYVRARPWRAGVPVADLALDATLRAAAARRARPLPLQRADLRRKERRSRQAYLILFVVDGSWSMAVARRMEATKGAVLSLLTQAYQHRDWVGMITFRRQDARLVLPPTRSVALARRALRDLPVGGKTPLAAGLRLAYRIFHQARRSHPELRPLLVLLTDGAGNVPLQPGGDPLQDAYRMAEALARAQIPGVVINLEHPQFDQGLADTLAQHLRAPVLRLPDLRADTLTRAVQQVARG